jgi:hypothetical protein
MKPKDYHKEHEVGIRLTGTEYKIQSSEGSFMLWKESCWDESMADQTKVIADGEVMTSAQAKRKHLHNRLDMWMDNNWRFE